MIFDGSTETIVTVVYESNFPWMNLMNLAKESERYDEREDKLAEKAIKENLKASSGDDANWKDKRKFSWLSSVPRNGSTGNHKLDGTVLCDPV